MDIITKKEVYKSLLTEIVDKKTLTEEELELITKEITKTVDEFYDLSQDIINPLTIKDTYIFRKINGILDNGVPQSQMNVARQIGISRARMGQIYTRIKRDVIKRILNIGNTKKEIKVNMTSLDNRVDCEILKNKSIGCLELSGTAFNRLRNRKVYTLGDLLQNSIDDLKKYLGDISIDDVVMKVHNMGLQFIDDLSIEERKEIISKAPSEILLNSTVDWIAMEPKTRKTIKKKFNITTLSELKDVMANELRILPQEVIECLYELGLNFKPNKVEFINNDTMKSTEFTYTNLDELLDMSIEKIEFTKMTKNSLLRAKIRTIRDLVTIDTRELKKIPFVGKIRYEEIIAKVHTMGLCFADEVSSTKNYYSTVYAHYQTISKIPTTTKEELMNRYEYLIGEKKMLEERQREIDRQLKETWKQINSITTGKKYKLMKKNNTK